MQNLSCPSCKEPLIVAQNVLSCRSCDQSFPIENEIPRFTESYDRFYEGLFLSSITCSKSVKDRMRHALLRRLRFLQGQLGKLQKSTQPLCILDLACGGGHEILCRYGNVTGLDISMASLRQAKGYYSRVVCASALNMPFASESFDVVVAMDFFGHIKQSEKTSLLHEINRVLKIGGNTLQYVETLGENSMQRMALKYPDLYKKYFVDPEGHIGLESPRTVLERFYNANLVPIYKEGAYKTWLKQPSEISRRYGGDLAKKYPWIRIPVLFDKVISKNTTTRFLATAVSEPASKLIDAFLPMQKSDGLFLVAQKGYLYE